MSYRDELRALRHRKEALETEVEELLERQFELECQADELDGKEAEIERLREQVERLQEAAEDDEQDEADDADIVAAREAAAEDAAARAAEAEEAARQADIGKATASTRRFVGAMGAIVVVAGTAWYIQSAGTDDGSAHVNVEPPRTTARRLVNLPAPPANDGGTYTCLLESSPSGAKVWGSSTTYILNGGESGRAANEGLFPLGITPLHLSQSILYEVTITHSGYRDAKVSVPGLDTGNVLHGSECSLYAELQAQ